MNGRTAKTVAAGLLGCVIGQLALGGSADAIPNSQENCAFDEIVVDQASGAQPIGGTGVSFTLNGTKRVVLNFSADMGVSPDAEARLSYSVDGGAPQEDVYGPANIANNAQFYETRHAMAVITLPGGTHTIQPYWRVSGGEPTMLAVADSRCFTAEWRTK